MPDSFAGDVAGDAQAGIRPLLAASIIVLGGASSRLGAEAVSVTEALKRVLPVRVYPAQFLAAGISVDTRKLEVAQAVFKVCVPITNDVTVLSVVHMAEVDARYHASLLLCIARLLQIRCNESHYMAI